MYNLKIKKALIFLMFFSMISLSSVASDYKITLNKSNKIDVPEPRYPKILSFEIISNGSNYNEQSKIESDSSFKLSYENVGRGENSNYANSKLYFSRKAVIKNIKISGACDFRSSSGNNSGYESHVIRGSNSEFLQRFLNRSSSYGGDYTTRSFQYDGVAQTKSGVYPLTSSDDKIDSLNQSFNFDETPIVINEGEYLTINVKNKYYTHSTGYGNGCHKTFEFIFD